MKKLSPIFVVALALASGLAVTRADTSGSITLPQANTTLQNGPNLALAQGKCLICHSTDYIYTQPPLTKTQWTAEVTKMQKTYGAPIADTDIPLLVDYLMSQNGKT